MALRLGGLSPGFSADEVSKLQVDVGVWDWGFETRAKGLGIRVEGPDFQDNCLGVRV